MTDLRNRGQVHPLFCLLLFWLAPYNVQTPHPTHTWRHRLGTRGWVITLRQ